MKVSGFSFIKNAIQFDYPIKEAIKSVLPICDEFVVAVGKSSDATLELIRQIDDPKIRIIETVWDETLTVGGKVLASETNKAFDAIAEDSDWCFYIQGDEVVHEKYLDTVYQNMLKYKDTDEVDGLLFHYTHFYGSYDYIGSAENWYKDEIRVIKNNSNIYSHRDAQGFRKGENEKLNVVPIDAYIYHYGWVKAPEVMLGKLQNFLGYWSNNEKNNRLKEKMASSEEYDFSGISELKLFNEEHPAVMKERIERINWKFEYDISFNKRKLKDSFKIFMRKYFGWDIRYKNYRKIKVS